MLLGNVVGQLDILDVHAPKYAVHLADNSAHYQIYDHRLSVYQFFQAITSQAEYLCRTYRAQGGAVLPIVKETKFPCQIANSQRMQQDPFTVFRVPRDGQATGHDDVEFVADFALPYVPYEPCRFEHFILSGRRILADQADYLSRRLPAHSRATPS